MNGWIKLHRSITDHWIFKDSEFLLLWITMLIEANHEPRKALFNGALLNLQRGQFVFGRKSYSEKTGVSENKIRRFLSLLISDQMIHQQTTNKFSLITITNYDKYQNNDQQATSKIPTNHQPATTPKELKNYKKERIEEIFEHWKVQMGKTTARLTDGRKQKIRARLDEGYSVDQIKQAITNCSKSAWHMGKNNNNRKYNEIDLICRNGEKLESFRDMQEEKPLEVAL